MAAKFFTGLPLDGPDPECVFGHGERLLAARGDAPTPRPSVDMSRKKLPPPPPRPATVVSLPVIQPRLARACDESPLARLW
jgi:mycofactocin biosynthetic radical S-adenosylmethionine protein MftC